MKVRFTVNRERADIDGEDEIVECIIDRPESIAKKIVWNSDDYDSDVADEFCYEVPRIVKTLTGLNCSPDWHYEDEPEFA